MNEILVLNQLLLIMVIVNRINSSSSNCVVCRQVQMYLVYDIRTYGLFYSFHFTIHPPIEIEVTRVSTLYIPAHTQRITFVLLLRMFRHLIISHHSYTEIEIDIIPYVRIRFSHPNFNVFIYSESRQYLLIQMQSCCI